ncbi:MAG: hypothetical protein Q4F05_17555 [bacterium]|nr:hypothetical protein [bacterium]
MYGIFKICFCAGLILIILGFLIGQFSNVTGIDGLDLSFGDFSLPLSFSPSLVFLVMTIFGGIGMLLSNYIKGIPVVLTAAAGLISGIIVAGLIQKFIIRPLKKAENTSAAKEEELIGVLATVSETIPKQGFGEITYVIYGNTYMAPAKSTNGEEISKRSEVSICWIKDHVFYVVKI